VAAVTGLPDDLASLARIGVANHPSGAPYVRLDDAPLPLAVSLTDRAGWAVCLVSDGEGPLGCDLEIVEPRSAGFVADFLTPAEQDVVASSAAGAPELTTNLIWSAKESALKVLQTGLRRDTRTVEVVLGPPQQVDDQAEGTGWARLEVRTREGGVMPGWWRRDGVFLVTVAAQAPVSPPALLPGSSDLAAAQPVHSWLARPLSPARRTGAPQPPP
jgi:4'-phosphopantetheinyl transferase